MKLRNQPAQNLAQAVSPATSTVNLAGVAAQDRDLASLLSRHAVRKASPVFPGAVRAKRQQGLSDTQLKNAMRRRFPARTARAPASMTAPDLSSTYVFELSNRPAADVVETIRSLRAEANVLYVEEDQLVQVQYIPNDPSYSSTGTWGQDYDDLYGLKKIGTTQAWDVTRGQGVVVAVVDTGIDYNHPDISNNIWINAGEISGNGIDDDNNGFIDDVRGWDFVGVNSLLPVQDSDPFDGHSHGTHVAGTVAATGDNNLGVVGVAWQAKVMAVKGLADDGFGYESYLAKAIIYAVDNGADVINASWGTFGVSQTVTDAINYAHSRGVVFVTAAGNSAENAKDYSPANVPAAITVSALDPYDSLSSFSNFGSKVELAAPGEDISSLQSGTVGYSQKRGTSMAAPHVSGVAALIIAQHPTFSNEQVRQALRTSASDLGQPGKDTSFGYGRVNAAQAVLANQVLEAKILSPVDESTVMAPVPLTGSAGGPGFDHYIVDYGAGTAPGTWIALRNSTTSVTNGDIGTLDATRLPDGIYTVRLRAFHTGGAVYSDQILVQVRYLQIASPRPPRVPSLTQAVKTGVPLPISGRATGPSFQNYVLEWALGSNATSGWSTGFNLPGSGLSPVVDGPLGTWTPPGSLRGYCTLRLTVNNAEFSSETTTVVYVEPALISNGWPQFAQDVWYEQNVQPVRQPDGSTRFVLCGVGSSPKLYSFAIDGSAETVSLGSNGSYFQPCVANLDGEPGDEIVVSDGDGLKIFSSNLALLRTISPGSPMKFGYEQVSLADLDHDGVPEIIAPARNTDTPAGELGVLYVYRTDGTLFSSNYPLNFSSAGVQENMDRCMVVAVDLQGDGRKEIVAAVRHANPVSYSLEAFNADGTPYAGWSNPRTFPNHYLKSLAAADLDHDGTSELVVTEDNQTNLKQQIRVVNSTGGVRAGWPVLMDPGSPIKIAIGDLDADLQDEIVVATGSLLSVLRDDGTPWSQPFSNGGDPLFNVPTTPLIADIDSDGVPEIILGVSTTTSSDGPIPYRYGTLTSYRLNGSIQQSWPIFGTEGRQPSLVTPHVGDFNGDGTTDLAVNVALVEGGGINGPFYSTAVTCLTTWTPFNELGSPWTSRYSDQKNSRNGSRRAPTIITQPVPRSVFTGSQATFSVAANGDPLPTFQWRKNGASIPGETRATLTLSSAQLSDSGSYTVVATNLLGSVTSNPAVLTVEKRTPVVTWPTPAPVTYGTALSGTQLNATGSVAGFFGYVPMPTSGWVPNAGTHTIYLNFIPSDIANYNIVTTSVNLTVNKVPLVVTATDTSRNYGAPNPAFTAVITGFVNNDTASAVTGAPAFATPASSGSNTGVYPITPSLGTLSAGNYSFPTFNNGTLTVTTATLTVTADHKSKLPGTANPPLTISYAGFVNGDDASHLTTLPSATTSALVDSPVGTYPITLSGGVSPNYNFTYVAGMLSVVTQSIAPSNAVITITVE